MRGAAPFGVFARSERQAHLEAIRAWLSLLGGEVPVFRRLGPSRGGGTPADRVDPPLGVSFLAGGRELRLELAGDLQPGLWGGSLFLEKGKAGKQGLDGLRRKALRAFLDHLALTCLEGEAREGRAWFLFAGEGGRGASRGHFRFAPLEPGEARRRLADWGRALLEEDPAVLMPLEALLASWYDDPGPSAEGIRDFVDASLEAGESISTLRGPVPGAHRYDPPADPRKVAGERLGAFLEQVETFFQEEKP
jgi:hypothetical protein